MINLFCVKLCSRSLLIKHFLKYPLISPKLLNQKKFSTIIERQSERENQKIFKFHKQRKILNELQIIKYENNFQNQRRNQLKTINCKIYENWLNRVCSEGKETAATFDRKYRKIQYICQIYNDILKKTYRVPTKLTNDSMLDMMEMDSGEDISKQISYLYELEMKRWTEKELKKEESQKIKEKLEQRHTGRTSRIGVFNDQNELVYGLWHNTLFTRIAPKAKNNYISRTKLKTSAMFGQKLVIDFGFEEFLNNVSSKQLMSYLIKAISFNKYKLNECYDICFNNFDISGYLKNLMDNYFNEHDLTEYYIRKESDSYLNHFNFGDLCYICPQADEPLREYDHNAVYILPGVVYRQMNPPLTMMRVRREGIQMKRIPVEDIAPLKRGYCLELSTSFKVLSHLRDTNNMSEALKLHLPQTVWMDPNRVEDEDQTVIKKLFYQKMIDFQKKVKTYRKTDNY